MERGCQKVLCINPKGLSTSLDGFNFLPINWKELIQNCSELGEFEIQFDNCASMYYIP